jgi:hypothetical protein
LAKGDLGGFGFYGKASGMVDSATLHKIAWSHSQIFAES